MFSSNKDELRDSIRELLNDEAERNALDARGRVNWLVRQLHEYLDRWLGFCALPEIPMSSLVTGGGLGFAIVEAGTELLAEDLQNVNVGVAARQAWEAYRAQLAKVRSGGDKQDAQQLGAIYSRFSELLVPGLPGLT